MRQIFFSAIMSLRASCFVSAGENHIFYTQASRTENSEPGNTVGSDVAR